MRICSRNNNILCERKSNSICSACPVEVSDKKAKEADYKEFLKILKVQKRKRSYSIYSRDYEAL